MANGRTSNIHAALVADLEAINGSPPFYATVVSVVDAPVDIQRVDLPVIFLKPTEGGSMEDEASQTNKVGFASQDFHAEYVVRGPDPHTLGKNLLDSIRNAVERSSGNLWALTYVKMADVVEWSEVYTDLPVGKGYGIGELTVRVRYEYDRGAL